jgi:hypothetical protein
MGRSIRGTAFNCVQAVDELITTDALSAVIARSAISAGSAIFLQIDKLPFTPLNTGARSASVFDKICNHGNPPSGGIIIFMDQVSGGLSDPCLL